MCGIVYSGPYAVDEIVAYEDKNAGQQSLPLRSLDAVEQQESQKDTVESEDRTGSSSRVPLTISNNFCICSASRKVG